MTYIEREGIAFEEQLQIRVLLQHRVVRNLLNALLKRKSSMLQERRVEPVERALLGYGRDHDAGVVVR